MAVCVKASGGVVEVGSRRLIDVATPVAPSDGVNKAYVDGLVPGPTPTPTDSTITRFTYVNLGGIPLNNANPPESRVWTLLVAQPFLAPFTGTLYMETLTRCVSEVNGGSGVFRFRVNGVFVGEELVVNAYENNTNTVTTDMWQIDIVEGVTYLVESVGVSTWFGATPDFYGVSARLWLLADKT